MPTTYAHDLFGKEVYKRLPSDMKALLRRHGDSVQDRFTWAGYPVLLYGFKESCHPVRD